MGSNHEQFALETCLKVVFTRMPKVRPNAIVIDKCYASHNGISNLVAQDCESWIVAKLWVMLANKLPPFVVLVPC
mgnify:CR=1 FL=1